MAKNRILLNNLLLDVVGGNRPTRVAMTEMEFLNFLFRDQANIGSHVYYTRNYSKVHNPGFAYMQLCHK